MFIDYDKLSIWLVRARMNIGQLCTDAHISRATICRIKEGREITHATAIKICSALGCDIAELAPDK